MRIYGVCWVTAIGALAVASGVSAALTAGWVGLVVTGACATVLAGMVGIVWAEESDEPVRRTVVRCGAWGVAGGLLVVGLPSLLGPWSLLAILGLVLTAPPLVARAVSALHPRAGEDAAGDLRPIAADAPLEPVLVDLALLTDRELERRWYVTAARLRHPGTPPELAMELVDERVLLLDEIERRNPMHFAAIVDQAIGLREQSSDDRDGGNGG